MRVVFLCAVVLFLSLPALAQETTPLIELSGGYSFLRDETIDENTHGWLGSAAYNVNRWFGAMGEVGGNYGTVQVFATDVNLSVHSFAGGPRISSRGTATTMFAQLGLGAARGTVSTMGFSESTTEFMLQPGGGIDFWVRPELAVRIGGDYRRIFEGDDDSNQFRIHIGLLYGGRFR